jgi:F-type H+-transporting ATPase subunit gamma
MEMIAASKMRRSQERGLAGRPYAEKIQQVIANLAALPQTEEGVHPLLRRRPAARIAVVHITPDRGLCGGLNGNLNRLTTSFMLEQTVPVSLIAVGRKGLDFMRRSGGQVMAEFTHLGDRPGLLDSLPISCLVIDLYRDGFVDLVYLAYARFVSTMVQRPVLLPLLPVEPAMIPYLRAGGG